MSPYGHPSHKPSDDGRARRELTPMERIGWSNWQRERKRIQDRNANALMILISLLWLIVVASLAAITSSKAHAGDWGTLPASAQRGCFVDDGQFDCLFRVSDFDTLRFCPGTGDALHQPSPPGLILVGFTDPYTEEFTVVRQQAYQWRQLQPSQGHILIGVDPDVLSSFADGFEDCDEYRT